MENDSISVFYTKDFYFVSVLTKGVLCAKFALPPPSFWGVLVLYIAFPSHIKMYYFTSHKEKKWHSVFCCCCSFGSTLWKITFLEEITYLSVITNNTIN